MPMMLLAAMMMAQAPAAAPAAAVQPLKVKKHKAPQICEDIEITGSRSKRHVCHDADVDAGALVGVSHSMAGKGTSQSVANGSVSAGTLPQD